MTAAEDVKTEYFKTEHSIGATAFEVLGLSLPGYEKSDVSFTLRKGEVMGMYSADGGECCRKAVRAMFGLNNARKGILSAGGNNLRARKTSPADALSAGIDYLDGSNDDVHLSLLDYIILPSIRKYSKLFFYCRKSAVEAARKWCEKLEIACSSLEQPVCSLNLLDQRKASIARMLEADAKVLIFDNPAQGLDVEERATIYSLMDAFACEGKSVIFICRDIDGLLGMCDTIMVMHEGSGCPPRPVANWTVEEINKYAASGKAGAFSIL